MIFHSQCCRAEYIPHVGGRVYAECVLCRKACNIGTRKTKEQITNRKKYLLWKTKNQRAIVTTES